MCKIRQLLRQQEVRTSHFLELRKKVAEKIGSPKQRFWKNTYRPLLFPTFFFEEEVICFFVVSCSPSGWTGVRIKQLFFCFLFLNINIQKVQRVGPGSLGGPLRAQHPIGCIHVLMWVHNVVQDVFVCRISRRRHVKEPGGEDLASSGQQGAKRRISSLPMS